MSTHVDLVLTSPGALARVVARLHAAQVQPVELHAKGSRICLVLPDAVCLSRVAAMLQRLVDVEGVCMHGVSAGALCHPLGRAARPELGTVYVVQQQPAVA